MLFMKNKPIIILAGESKSVFFEIFFKSLKFNNFKSPIILISSMKILKSEMKKNRFKKEIISINLKKIRNTKLNNKSINLIDVDHHPIYVSKKDITSGNYKVYKIKDFYIYTNNS